IDPKAGTVLSEMSIVVNGGNIVSVEKGYMAAAAGDKVIDLKNRTVMPGLIDSHVHLEGEFGRQAQLKEFTMGTADIAFQSTVYARTPLLAVFTMVRMPVSRLCGRCIKKVPISSRTPLRVGCFHWKRTGWGRSSRMQPSETKFSAGHCAGGYQMCDGECRFVDWHLRQGGDHRAGQVGGYCGGGG